MEARPFFQASRQSFLCQLLHIGFACEAFRHLELREIRFVEREVEAAGFGDLDGVRDGVGISLNSASACSVDFT